MVRATDGRTRSGGTGPRAVAVACTVGALTAVAVPGPAQAAEGNPRFLVAVDRSDERGYWDDDIPARLNGELYSYSLRYGSSSAGFREYDLGRQCTALTFTAGIDERQSRPTTAPVVVTTSADGTPVDTRTVAPGAPQSVTLDVTGALRVRFAVAPTDDGEGAGGTTIGNPVALCSGTPVVAGAEIRYPCSSSSFTDFDDVDSDQAHAQGIACLTDYGIATGTSPTTYDPQRPVTRGQMAAFLARLVITTGGSLPPSPPDAFGDDNGTRFERDINQLAAVGIVRGGADRRYNSEGVVTRGQMAAFLSRTFAYRYGHPLASGPTIFTDTGGTAFDADISRVAGAGIASGYGDGSYGPAAPVTRAQMATFIARTLRQLYRAGDIVPSS